jgi:hypothetical protein
MDRGGSHWRSGRSVQKVKAEQLHRLDIRQINQRGLLHLDTYRAWSWTRNGEPAGRVVLAVYENSIGLAYWAKASDTAQTIETTDTPCANGGSRRRFACWSCQCVSYST